MQVALFPIPDVVAFPGTILPLHIFEPRYRTMISDAIEAERMIGVCHTRKEIHSARKNQTISEALSTNQATYDPQHVFSAGPCEIVETTDDGRIYANINMSTRLVMGEEVQTLPYRIVDCEELADQEVDEEADELVNLKRSITAQMLQLAGPDNLPLKKVLVDPRWNGLPASKFSFKLFQFLRFEADIMQDLLELTDPQERLVQIETYLRDAVIS